MARCFLSCLLLFVGLCCLPGCGGDSGGPAEFKESAAQTTSEVQEADDYAKMMAEQDAANK